MNSRDEHNPRWDIERELPVSADALLRHADDHGSFAASSPSSRWSGLTVEQLMPIILRVAQRELDARSYDIFVSVFVKHETQQSIANRLGMPRGNVSNSLFGRVRRAGYWLAVGAEGTADKQPSVRHGGSMKKIKQALETDEQFQAAVAQMGQPVAPDPRTVWFRGHLTPRSQNLIGPLFVLLMLDCIADQQSVTTYADAIQVLPASLINGHLTQLRLLGWVETDGVAIKILWRPTDEKNNEATA